MKLFVLSDNTDTLEGMRLAGVDGKLVHEKDEFEKAFSECKEDGDISVIAITHKLYSRFGTLPEEHIKTGKSPLVIEIPDRHGNAGELSAVTEHIKNNTGIEI